MTRANGEILLDRSYAGGTAACSLKEKFEWKNSKAADKGPPPFKGPDKPPFCEKLKALGKALGFSVGDAELDRYDANKEALMKEIKAAGGLSDPSNAAAWFASKKAAAATSTARAMKLAIEKTDEDAVDAARAELGMPPRE